MGIGNSNQNNNANIENAKLRELLKELINNKSNQDSPVDTLNWDSDYNTKYNKNINDYDNIIYGYDNNNYDNYNNYNNDYDEYNCSKLYGGKRNRYEKYDGMNMSNIVQDMDKLNADDGSSITSNLSELRIIKDNLKRRMQEEIKMSGGGNEYTESSNNSDSETSSESSSENSVTDRSSEINIKPLTMKGGSQPFYSSDSTSDYFRHLQARRF